VSAPAEDSDRALAGRLVAVLEARQLEVLAGLLERRGASVLRCPLVGIVDAPDEGKVVAWIERLVATPTDLAIFYTGEGIERLHAFATRAGLERALLAALARTPKLTRGPKPRRALRKLGLAAEHEAAEPTTAGLVAALSSLEFPTARVAIQLYDEGQDQELARHLKTRGVAVDSVAPYRYAAAADDAEVEALIVRLATGRVDAIAFTSAAQVRRLLAVAADRGLEPALGAGLIHTHVVAVGPVVAAELAEAGIRVDAIPADSFSLKPLVTSLSELLRAD
jgi:uroporphyrinogen-III synthase